MTQVLVVRYSDVEFGPFVNGSRLALIGWRGDSLVSDFLQASTSIYQAESVKNIGQICGPLLQLGGSFHHEFCLFSLIPIRA